MQKEMTTLDDIRDGLGQMEEWCRVLRDAVDHYDPASEGMSFQDGPDPSPQPINPDPPRGKDCPPPERDD